MDINQGLRSGTFLRNGTYQIIKILGQGGFGITYLALDTTLDRYVCIKEFFPSGYCDRDTNTSHVTTVITNASDLVLKLKQKFIKEAKNIAKFDHPGIIKIFAAFEENNTAYYVMEYIEGGSLDDFIKANGRMTENDAVEVIKRVGNALEYIHGHQFNHLDIKPANIMVRSSSGQPILIDFGVSKQYDQTGHQTSTTPVGLSHGYSPLEQYEVGGISQFSPQTDLYSLAATLFYLLTGTNPPEAARLVNNPLVFPPGFNPEIAASITQAMSAARVHRQLDIPHFIAELVNAENRDIPIPPPTNFSNKTQLKSERTIIESHQSTDKSRRSNNLGIVAIVVGVVIFLFVTLVIDGAFHSSNSYSASDCTDVVSDTDLVVVVTSTEGDVITDIPDFGRVRYNGWYLEDESSGKILPEDEGAFEVLTGDLKGAKYEGHLSNGMMNGEGRYVFPDGSTLEGTFIDNLISEGTYKDASSGEYFVGTFKEGSPDKGTWYTAQHEILQKIK